MSTNVVLPNRQKLTGAPPDRTPARVDNVISKIYLGGTKLQLDLAKALIDINMEITIDGASTITASFLDENRTVINSPYLNDGTRMQIPRSDELGKWDKFALVKVSKTDDTIELIFEEENVWRLRKYDAPLKISRDRYTRAQFAWHLCREPRPRVPFFSPELLEKQPIAKVDRKDQQRIDQQSDNQSLDMDRQPYGFAQGETVKVKGKTASTAQRNNIARVLAVGVKLRAPKMVLYAAITTITQESEANNLQGGDRDSVGLFQQRPSQGWRGLTNIERAAEEFFLGQGRRGGGAISVYKQNPSYDVAEISQAVQRSAFPRAYARWENEARRTVAAYLGNDARGYSGSSNRIAKERYKTYEFTRGDPEDPKKRENSWDAMGRLADEVNWVRFCYRGTVYFMSEEELFSRLPVAQLRESDPGVDFIDFEYDTGQPVGEVSIQVNAERWSIPPGSVISIIGLRPIEDRWLVTDFERSLFDNTATVTLRRPEPKLPEPAPEVKTREINLDTGQPIGGAGVNAPWDGQYHTITTTPLPRTNPAYGYSDPEGQSGRHAAFDWFAPSGAPVYAPCPGRVFRVKADPNPGRAASGQVFGGSIYMMGADRRPWVFRHLQDIRVKVGDSVAKGERIAGVKNWTGRSHVHVEAYKKGSRYRYSFDIAVDPVKVLNGQNVP